MQVSPYNPYTYNRALNAYFMTGNTANLDLPRDAAQLAQTQPALATHINSMWRFIGWLQKSSPDLYNVITNQKPQLLDPASVVGSGAMTPTAKRSTLKGLAGLGDMPMDTFVTIDSSGNATPATPDTSTSPATTWGQGILDTLKASAPAYFQLKSQSNLMTINIKRAEQGLPPIDSSALAPTVNVGVSSGVQTMGYVAIGGLMLFGLIAMLKRKR